MSSNGVNNAEDTDMADCDGQKVVTMMDVLKEQQDFEDDANAVLGASDEKNCTYSKGYIKRQAIYACMTCCSEAKDDPSKRAGVCLACSLSCHDNHELVELYTKRNFRCDCGNPKFNHPCQYTPDKNDLNNDNKYNQNFSGLYCNCHRPYPDPDATEEDEMIQCIICEDWLHTSHLDAVVPSNEHYAEMICKACMAENDFLHDYTNLAVNEIEVDVTTLNGTDKIEACEEQSKKFENGVQETHSEKPANMDVDETDEVETRKDIVENESPDVENEADLTKDKIVAEKTESSQEPENFETTNTVLENSTKEQETESGLEEKLDENPPNTSDVNADSTETPKADNLTEETKADFTEETKADSTEESKDLTEESKEDLTEESKEDMTKESEEDSPTNSNANTAEELKPDFDYTKENVNEHKEADDAANTENAMETADDSNNDNISEAKTTEEINPTETTSEVETNDQTSEVKTNDESEKNIVENTNESTIAEDKLDLSDTANKIGEDSKEITPEDAAITSNVIENMDSIDENLVKENINGDLKENSDAAIESDINTEESKMESSNDSETTSGKESDEIPNDSPIEKTHEVSNLPNTNPENKRRLSTEEGIDENICKKPKLDESKCSRPKGVKRLHKGAVFWPSNFRQKLCTCGECLGMYKDLSVLFLIDVDDTASAYEILGKERDDHATQYEKGLEALSSLDRTQQINALTEYNKMRDKLLDYLKSFKDRKEIVKEEDIKAFFAGMKPKRESDGVYFCR